MERQQSHPPSPTTCLYIDEIALRKGHSHFETVLANQQGQVLNMVEGKQSTCIQTALKQIPGFQQIEKVCMDMCASFAHAVAEALPQAEIIADRFHLIRHLNKALDNCRKTSHAKLDKAQRKRFSRIHFLLGRKVRACGRMSAAPWRIISG